MMKISLMKAIDHYVGRPLCLALDIYCRFRSLFPTSKFRHPQKILIMKYFGMGSILLASPMLRALKQKFPEAEIGFLTFAQNEDILGRMGVTDNIYTLRTGNFQLFLWDLFRQLRLIRKERYDVTIDMEFFAKFSTIMTFLSGSPIRIGYFLRQMWRGDLLTNQVYYNHYKHVTEVFGALAEPLGGEVKDMVLERPAVYDEEYKAADILLRKEGIEEGDRLIGFNVNVSDLAMERRWPKEEFPISCKSFIKRH